MSFHFCFPLFPSSLLFPAVKIKAFNIPTFSLSIILSPPNYQICFFHPSKMWKIWFWVLSLGIAVHIFNFSPCVCQVNTYIIVSFAGEEEGPNPTQITSYTQKIWHYTLLMKAQFRLRIIKKTVVRSACNRCGLMCSQHSLKSPVSIHQRLSTWQSS